MIHLTSRLLMCASILLCGATMSSLHQHQVEASANGNRAKNTPQGHISLGPLSIDVFYNSIDSKEKLRLNKSYVKLVPSKDSWLSSKLLPNSLGVSWVEELIACQNITLKTFDDMQPVACESLEIKHSPTFAPGQVYARRFSVHNKNKFSSDMSLRTDIEVYPTSDLLAGQRATSLLAQLDIDSKEFENWQKKFMYFDSALSEHFFNYGVSCSGEILVMTNHTDIQFDIYDTQTFTDSILSYLVDKFKHGVMIDVRGHCRLPGSPFEIKQQFVIVKKQTFPYLTLRHIVDTMPFEGIWSYVGVINQRRHADEPKAYNTTIYISSKSFLTTSVKFELDQIFVNHDDKNNNEEMFLVAPGLTSHVTGNRTETKFEKEVKVFFKSLQEMTSAKELVPSMKPDFFWRNAESHNDDFVTYSVGIKKELHDSIIGAYWPSQVLTPKDKDTKQEPRYDL